MKTATKLTALGRDPDTHYGTVNPPIHRASTLVFPSFADMEAAHAGTYKQSSYGTFGMPITHQLQQALAELEGGDTCRLSPSGQVAVTMALLAYLNAGDHLLITDSAYEPTRRFCNHELTRLGVEVTYYDPMIGGGIRDLMKPNTKVIFTESPGSLSFEVQDIPAIAEEAHKRGAIVIQDNSWATPLLFQPFEHGVDVSVQAVTKYLCGHADLLMGAIIASKAQSGRLKEMARNLGMTTSPDDCYLALRGMRTLSVRLERQQQTALKVAEWLKQRPEVVKVLHPAFPECPGHEIWKRDFKGSTGLFSVLVKPAPRERLAAMFDNMRIFRMGYSWGGYESLMIPFWPQNTRTATQWTHDGVCLRIHTGLEDADDLIADLRDGFARLGGK